MTAGQSSTAVKYFTVTISDLSYHRHLVTHTVSDWTLRHKKVMETTWKGKWIEEDGKFLFFYLTASTSLLKNLLMKYFINAF